MKTNKIELNWIELTSQTNFGVDVFVAISADPF